MTNRIKEILVWTAIIAVVTAAIGTAIAIINLGDKITSSNLYYADATLSNEQIKLLYTDEAVSIANYTDDTHEPTGWELFPSIFWDSNTNGTFEANESVGHALSPCVHFTHDDQTYHFWPLHQSIMQDPEDPHVVSSGWISPPHIYRSTVEDADQLLTVECTISVLDGNNYFTQEINITSTALSTLTNVNLIAYIGIDINGPFDDYAFIDSCHNNMLKAYDNETGVWFGAYPSIRANSFEVSEWNDGPYEGDDLWQHALNDDLDGITTSTGDVEGALKFYLHAIQPGESKSLTIHCSFGVEESDLYVPSFPHDIAVANITPSKTVVGEGYSLLINVTVENQGTNTETFNVTLYTDGNITLIGDEIAIGNQTVPSLANGASTTLTFTWNTTGFVKGNYTISAYAWPVLGETDTADNTLFAEKCVCVSIVGDLDCDRDVDLYDAVKLLVRYGAKKGSPSYDPVCDIDGDGSIDLYDAVRLLTRYGQKDP